MKSIFAAALFAAFLHVAVAADASSAQASTAAAPKKDKVEKACYKEEHFEATDPSYLDDWTISGPVTSALTRIPCPPPEKAVKK